MSRKKGSIPMEAIALMSESQQYRLVSSSQFFGASMHRFLVQNAIMHQMAAGENRDRHM